MPPPDGKAVPQRFSREPTSPVRFTQRAYPSDPVGALRRRIIVTRLHTGDFEKLAPFEGCIAALGVPALIAWGEEDRFADVQMAHRFHEELPGSEPALFKDAGHFIWDDQPERATRALVDFLERRAR
jgi:pimeloyl-ACP methyl ester carboxylesterase